MENNDVSIEIFNPDTLDKPIAQYSHAVRVEASRLLFIAGQLSNDRDGNIVGIGDFEKQAAQAFENVHEVLKTENLDWGNLVYCVYYLTDSRSIQKLHKFRQEHFSSMFPGAKYPPATLLVVNGLVREEFLFEVQAVAAY
ncbi:RidA family protein [Mesorhizobium sp.]|uniref:RidA family protein n=1 Tax=Mesorhizobium sp. TaxID=1871066 RepID=UPI000FE8D1AF|nr:RidA family protein [Mesorhizobium sp.]RWK66572.1 MAG: RidA family protein [Mesorhizobium sp.]